MNSMEIQRALKDADPKLRYVILSIHERQGEIDKQMKQVAGICADLAGSLQQLTGQIFSFEEKLSRQRDRDSQVEGVSTFDEPKEG